MDITTSQERTFVTLSEQLLREIRRHHDPAAQMRVAKACAFLLVRFVRLGHLFGVIVLQPNLSITWQFRSAQVIHPDQRQQVQKLFEEENRRRSDSRWFVATDTGEVRFAGDLSLSGKAKKDLRTVRRALFRRVRSMDRDIGEWFVSYREV